MPTKRSGFTASEAKARRTASRLKYHKAHPETQRRANRKFARTEQREAWKMLRTAQARALLPAVTRRECKLAGLTVTNKKHDNNLYFIDHHGTLHHEENLSAEQLIVRYETKQRKGENEKQKTAGQETPQGAGHRKARIPAGPEASPRPPHRPVTVTAQPRESREPMTNTPPQPKPKPAGTPKMPPPRTRRKSLTNPANPKGGTR